jgi:hypothetical protein
MQAGEGVQLLGRTRDGRRERSPGGQQQARQRGQRARQRRAQRRALGEAAAAPGAARAAVGPVHARQHTRRTVQPKHKSFCVTDAGAPSAAQLDVHIHYESSAFVPASTAR